MGVIAEAIRHMIAGGMSSEAIVIAVEAMEKASHPQRTARQERNSRYYSKKKEASENRLKASYSDAPPSLDGFNGFLEPSLTSLETLPPIVPPQKTLLEDFDEFWKAYPRKVSKGQARKAYQTARKKTDAPAIMAGLAKFNQSVLDKETDFIAHAATWLNGERWNDDYTRAPPQKMKQSVFDKYPMKSGAGG